MPVAKKKRSAAREARQAAYRTLVVEAAERVFATKGFDGAKIKDIADAAGLALGTVYALFRSKRDVFIAVHALRGGALLNRILTAVEGFDSPFSALSRMQRSACEFYAEHPNYLRMHLYSATSWASPRLDVDEERRAFERGVRLLVMLFERAAADGELIEERPETCARIYLAMMQVMLAEWEAESFTTAAADVAARFDRHILRTLARAPRSASTSSPSRAASR
jgi:AcrR family transcriptional regulator